MLVPFVIHGPRYPRNRYCCRAANHRYRCLHLWYKLAEIQPHNIKPRLQLENEGLALTIYCNLFFITKTINLSVHDKSFIFQVYGLVGAKSIKLGSLSGNTIGVWHIPPSSTPDEPLSDARKLIVYCHGNAFHRGFDHRLQLYKRLIRRGKPDSF